MKIAMCSPRGNLQQRPRAPNPPGSKPHGAFRGAGIAGFQRKPVPGTPQGISQRFIGHETLQRTGPRRTNVQVTQHRLDPRQAKEMANLQNEPKEKVRTSRWDNNPCSTGNTSRKHSASTRITEQHTNVQSRYTTESASSILASFGLSNEDLEELSRYPDDQLTPENMPLILRDIRMRKMGHQLPNLHSQSREKETIGGTGGSAVKSKVIDYGHTSRYGYSDDPLEMSEYNPEQPTEENRKEFQPQESLSVPTSNVSCNPMFPMEELMKQMGFHTDSSNTQSFFSVDSASKVPGLCLTPTGLPVVKPMTSVMTSVQQSLAQPSMSQSVMPPITHPPFSAELLAAVRQHERIQRDSETNQSNAHIGSGQKNFQSQVEGPIKSPFGVVKASWLPVFSQAAAQKIKRLPTPSMMNDYYATSPRIFPHMCSLCNVECTHMKDWIQHQNNPAHLESCRQLRQQYPDWNPEAHSSKRNEGDRKENQTPKRRSNSASPGPRHSRGSGSGHVLRRSRSRSRSPGRFRLARPRSRSPRQMRRLSPRHRSRSPQRSRNPLRSSPRPQRSASNEWASRRTARSPDKKAALEAVVKSLGASFVAEFNKQKSLQAAGQGSSGIGKASPARGMSGVGKVPGTMKKPLNATGHHKTLKKDLSSVPGSSASKMKSETADAQEKKLLREKLLSCGTVLHITDLPDDGFSDQDIKKIVQPFGKVSDFLVLRSRNEAFLEMNYKEAVVAAVKYGETAPVLVNGKRVKKLQVKVSVKKMTQSIKKAALSTKKEGNSATIKKIKSATAAASAVTSAKLTKTGQTTTRAVKLAEAKKKDTKTKKVADPKRTVENKTTAESKKAVEARKTTECKKAGQDEVKEISKPVTVQENLDAKSIVEVKTTESTKKENVSKTTAEVTKSEEPTEPASKELDDICVVVISNLPDKGYSVEEVSNLTKPFGGLKDVLILSSHKKAYLEITQKSADSMVKFYTCFPMSVDGNQLCISMAPEYKNVKDEEAIFTAMIKNANLKVNTETLYNQFVHLGNLPDEGYTELEVVCVGLRFGKVDHYVVLKNKKKAILQLDSPDSAKSMCCFLKQYPYNMGENTLTCMLSPRIEPAEVSTNYCPPLDTFSSDLKKNPEGSGVVQTAAANPPVEPSVAKEEIISNSVKAETSAVQIEASELDPERTVCDSTTKPLEVETSKGESEVAITGSATKPDDDELPQVKSEEIHRKEEVVKDNSEIELLTSALPTVEEKETKVKLEELNAVSDAVETKLEIPVANVVVSLEKPEKPAAKVGAALEKKLEKSVAKIGTAIEKKLEKPVASIGMDREKKSEKPVANVGTDVEKKPEKSVADIGTDIENTEKKVLNEKNEKTSIKVHQNKGPGQVKIDETSKASTSAATFVSIKEPTSVSKTILKAVVSIPDISNKTEEQKASSKPETRSRSATEKKLSSKEVGQLRATGSRSSLPDSAKSKLDMSPVVVKGGSGRSPSQQDKDSRVESRGSSKQSQERESRSSSMKKDDNSNKVPAGRISRNSKTGSSDSVKPKEEEELFPFNLDEFVTVDEVVEETDSPVPVRRNPPRGKRKDSAKNSSTFEPVSKRKKGKSCIEHVAESELSFVTLDEIGEEEEATALVLEAITDPQGLVTVDEVNEEELIAEAVKDPQSLVTLDEISEQEDFFSHDELKDVSSSIYEEQDLLKAEPLVTVDEIGEVEEIPLNEPSDLNIEETLKPKERDDRRSIEDPGDFISSQLPEDPSTLVTVDEIQEDGDDQPLVTLDEVTEDDEDFLADFNRLKEELNFVTVDEVGEEDEEEELQDQKKWKFWQIQGQKRRRILKTQDQKKRRLLKLTQRPPVNKHFLQKSNKTPSSRHSLIMKTPGKRGRPRKRPVVPPPETPAETEQEKALTDEFGSGDTEPESKRRKVDSSADKSKTPSTPKDLDFLVPKAGYFCQICSLFYADEMSMKNHCKTLRHQQNMEKFMAKQKDGGDEEENEGEELSSR
uniref:Zinc finger protein 638 n=2 Tax=Pelodiscus sinensis TaxID=13735 RepID=K7FXB7_PELSI